MIVGCGTRRALLEFQDFFGWLGVVVRKEGSELSQLWGQAVLVVVGCNRNVEFERSPAIEYNSTFSCMARIRVAIIYMCSLRF